MLLKAIAVLTGSSGMHPSHFVGMVLVSGELPEGLTSNMDEI